MDKQLRQLGAVLCGTLILGIYYPINATTSGISSTEMAMKKSKQKHIKTVEKVNVETPVGTVPRLPFMVWVTYSDGSKEWRQVKWSNYLLGDELELSSAEKYPSGKKYTINGFIIGDNTSDKGFPVTAKVTVVTPLAGESWNVPNNKFAAEPIPLSDVIVTGDNRLTSNRNMELLEILKWDVKQQLYNYRDTYGLPTKGYPVSDGWDSPTTKLKGHGSGHYMSALAFAFASVQMSDEELKANGLPKDIRVQLRDRIETMVTELRACQERTFEWDNTLGRYWEARDYAPEDTLKKMKGNWAAFDQYKKDYKHYGYGYLNAIPAAHPALIECYRAYNNEEWVWAPYYTIHKELAGLIDIANIMFEVPTTDEYKAKHDGKKHLSNTEIAKIAYTTAKDMGLWVWNRLHYRTYVKSDGSKAERQAKPGNRYEMWNMYIAGEVGGMAESLSRLSEMSDDKDIKAKLIEAASYFDSPAFFDPVAKNVDDIRTRHANQHIPMIVGALRSYLGNNKPYYYNLAYNFWNLTQGRYVYAMGGVGNGEMFRQPYSQILSMNTNVGSDWERNMYPNPDINETCCAYNMAKLTKDLNCFNPDNAEYMDYYERVLYNQIVGSLHPEHWGVTYQYAVGMNAIKPFGNENPQSSCCGGTGAENHVKYQEAAYFVNDECIWVGLYLPTRALWKNKNVTIVQDCEWPAEKSKITINTHGHDAYFAMKLRVPYWATSGYDVKINGKSIAKNYKPCSYVEIPSRKWSNNDVVEVIMPFTAHINWGPDKMSLAATGKNQTRTPFSPQWVGAIMYGPLVMATNEVKDWKEADFNIQSNLNNITLLGATNDKGTNGHLYSLKLDDKTFTPDYYQTHHSTHYLRLNMLSDVKKKVSKKIDKSQLLQVIIIARERKDSQEAWNALSVKIPNYAPWAPNGYARLLKNLENAESIYSDKSKNISQRIIEDAERELNVAINTMRPGNLAEPEDLNELLPLLTDSKNIQNKTTQLREAIQYADMVVQYVNDGSGTHDLITKATKNLKEALKTVKSDKKTY
ncbi:MAG: glycoside hydrolase family 127 protein [Bacteroidaceae bacterium]|nr:glycoside hydrolase family 127 protein [Bacteroidaceae bacterium]